MADLPIENGIIATADRVYRQWLEQDDAEFRRAIEAAVRAGVRLALADQLPRTSSLTPRLRQLLAFIEAFVEKHGFCPSYDEMAASLGLSAKSGVKRMIDELVERGVVQRVPYRSRAITLLATTYAAGQPEVERA